MRFTRSFASLVARRHFPNGFFMEGIWIFGADGIASAAENILLDTELFSLERFSFSFVTTGVDSGRFPSVASATEVATEPARAGGGGGGGGGGGLGGAQNAHVLHWQRGQSAKREARTL